MKNLISLAFIAALIIIASATPRPKQTVVKRFNEGISYKPSNDAQCAKYIAEMTRNGWRVVAVETYANYDQRSSSNFFLVMEK
jgi:opacity protein-like surface antigen